MLFLLGIASYRLLLAGPILQSAARQRFRLVPLPPVQYTPSLVCKPLSAARCIHVACGGQHTLALTVHDDLFGFGSDRHGQLGLGQGGVVVPVPSRCGANVVHVLNVLCVLLR